MLTIIYKPEIHKYNFVFPFHILVSSVATSPLEKKWTEIGGMVSLCLLKGSIRGSIMNVRMVYTSRSTNKMG